MNVGGTSKERFWLLGLIATLALVVTVLIPLFLFSATFYPISVYPGPLQVVVQLTPLYHGVDLIRSLTTGVVGPSIVVDIVYLAILGMVALAVAATRLQRLLLK